MLKSKAATCPLCGLPADVVTVFGVQWFGCKCVPKDSLAVIRQQFDKAAIMVAASTPLPVGGVEAWLTAQSWFGETVSGPSQDVCECFAAHLCAEHALDVEYDGVTLRDLLIDDERARRYDGSHRRFTPAQRAAVSAHWSAELRARVAAAKAKERQRVVVDLDVEDL